MKRFFALATSVCFGLIVPQVAPASDPPRDLADATLEQLMNIKVVSASKKAQSLETTAASVFVITSEDIRRSGIHSLPELLRLAPGVQVARTVSGHWAISIRGFNSDFSNKLLVMVDGRVVYNEEWAGVFWDMQEMAIENIDRIEVVRGPGAAMWGANAVNGVINILSKPSESTQGGLVTAEAGSQDANSSARFGGTIKPGLSYRITGQFGHQDALRADPSNPGGGVTSPHGWFSDAADFRVDWKATPADSLFVSGSAYHSTIAEPITSATVLNPYSPRQEVTQDSLSGTLMANWRHDFANGSSLEGKVSWDHTEHGLALLPLGYTVVESELLYHFSLPRNDVTWGVDYRAARYHSTPTSQVLLQPAEANADSYSSFVEDQVTVLPNKVFFIAGVNVGHNSFTGIEVQPTGRLLWTPSKKLTSWGAVSRAVRTPVLIERGMDFTDFIVPLSPTLLGVGHALGDPGTRAETVLAYEAGQRIEINRRVSLDVSGFWNRYQHLIAGSAEAPFFVPSAGGLPAYEDIPTVARNSYSGRSHGLELSAAWSVAQHWKLNLGYSWLRVSTTLYPGFQPSAVSLNNAPVHQWQLRSNWDVTGKIQLDTALYFTGAIPEDAVARHFRGDLRIGWRPGEKIEFSTGIQDAFQPYHRELPSLIQGQQLLVGRNIYGAITWRF